MSDLEAAFDGDPALVSYIAAGDPSVEQTKEYVRALVEGGSDVIELGLPFSEPIAEGPTIQKAVKRALDAGMTPERYLDLVRELREEGVEVPLVCMTYYNLLLQHGQASRSDAERASAEECEARASPEAFVADAAEAGIDGFVIPDLPVDEAAPLKAACDEHGLDLVFIVAPTTTDDRLERMLSTASGFVYVQGRMGTTGAQDDVSEDAHGSLGRLREADIPKAVGFGISTGEHAREIVAGGADGIIVGSAFVDIIAEHADDGTAAERLREKAQELKDGAVAGAKETPESQST
ncbi:tryptophan synthase subunit alpha [Salarchaeum sp. III]|uniref:tryptophan synthase subunit alpha n=1 Tax=Salarchaeum sp. III TaxID=3107927 RepID=UPI002ED87FB2